MSNDKALPALFSLLAAVIIAASVHAGMEQWNEEDVSVENITLRCAIVPSPLSGHYTGLTVGQNYEMLEDYARSRKDTLLSIVLAESASAYIDSLKLGSVDILVLPDDESAQTDSILVSRSIEEATVWATSLSRPEINADIDLWMEGYMATDEYQARRDVFLLRYSPSRRAANGRLTPDISPYDELVRKYAGELGWDWRLLSAIIYQESKFHIEASSYRGATGLMQMRPFTARRYGVTDLLNPEENIKAGTAFLGRLKNIFSQYTEEDDELQKFVLAAYNAGEGRIMDCINYADLRKFDSSLWDNIVTIIPHMRDSSILQVDTVKHGIFQGYETINYVETVMDLYEDFKIICPQK